MAEEKAYFSEPPAGQDPSADRASSTLITETDYGFKQTSTNRLAAVVPRWFAAALPFALCLVAAKLCGSVPLVLAGLVLGAVAYSCCHVVLEWERAVVLRFGKLQRIAGPGLVFTVPIAESFAATVDMRVRSTSFRAEHVLTSDLVPVNVDAVLFWGVFDAKKASVEVCNYEHLVFWVAQTTLRDVMGSIGIADLSTRRVQIDREVAEILEEKTAEWGISVTSVEIRDIVVPEQLQDALSIEAQARQEYNARLILAEVEREAAEAFVDAANIYRKDELAVQLRAMNLVHDGVKEKGGLVVVPNAIAHAFDSLADFPK